MEAILPFNTGDRNHFIKCALEIGLQDFYVNKYVYMMLDSDLDVYPLMCEDRLSLLIYGWEICDEYVQSNISNEIAKVALPENVHTVIKRLMYHSLEIWFCKEWESCKPARKVGLFYCLRRAKDLLKTWFALLDWDYLLQFEMKPWRVPHLCIFFTDMKATKQLNESPSIEYVEVSPNNDDIAYLKREGLPLALLRLIKLFDAGSIEIVQYMAIRVVTTWGRIYAEGTPSPLFLSEEEKRCLLLICHVYLITVYELDDNRGFVIDNMVNNIRFYSANMTTAAINATSGTSAFHIARTCAYLQMKSDEFFEAFICNKFDKNCITSFAVSAHAYLSYLLGNMLNHLSSMNEEDFAANLEDFKRLLSMYVTERERSERFMLSEMVKQEKQRSSNTISHTVKNICEFQSKFCKGNRLTNIGSFERVDENEEAAELNGDMSVRHADTVFQSIPNNAIILNHAYNVLAGRVHKGWYLAKVVLLLKIIGQELNEIETWRYHPGLTTQFMLNLETKLSRYYVDLAQIFEDHFFMEQEFRLTAFYLNPNAESYKCVLRSGMRTNRRRQIVAGVGDDSEDLDRTEKDDKALALNMKFGLLSSTFDVQGIIEQTNLEAPSLDYEPLQCMLRSLCLPLNIVKDLLVVCFVPRNKGFAWAVNWEELRRRCRMLLKSAAKKRKLVELNMAEACDQLKFLKIDYEKYKNRPQIDYGAIELGYEGKLNFSGNSKQESDDEEDDDDEEEEYDEFEDCPKRSRIREEKPEEEELPDEFFVGTRRTRARTAAVIASAAINKRLLESKKAEDDQAKEELALQKLRTGDVNEVSGTDATDNGAPNVQKCELKDWLAEHTTYVNATEGFKAFPNIWDFDAAAVQTEVNNSGDLYAPRAVKTYNRFLHLAAAKGRIEYQTAHSECSIVVQESQSVSSDESTLKYLSAQNEVDSTSASDAYATYDKQYRPMEQMASDREREDKSSVTGNDLINDCLAKRVRIVLHRLTAADVAQLRQPKVFVNRIDMLEYTAPVHKRPLDVSDVVASSPPIESGGTTQKRRRKPAPKFARKLQQHTTSVIACDDSLSTATTTASTMSNYMELFDFIHISSSSSQTDEDTLTASSQGSLSPATAYNAGDTNEDPLYEEEIMI